MKTSFFRSIALSLALLAGSAVSAAYADTPPTPKFHSPFGEDKDANSGEAKDFADLLDLYKKLRDAGSNAANARACGGSQDAVDKADAARALAEAAFAKALDEYIRGYSNNLYPPPGATLTPKQKELEKQHLDEDKKKMNDELNKRLTALPPPPACPSEHTSLPGGDTAWTGPFIGFDVVASGSEVGLFEYFAPTDALTNEFHDSGSGVGVGINGGWNWQPWDGNIVVGAVFNVDLVHDGVRHDFPGGAYIGSVTTFNGTAQVRGGMLVTPEILVYGQTGFTVGDQTLNIDFGGPETSEHKSSFGYVLGGGAEMLVPGSLFGGQMSLFVDYDHAWWNDAWLFTPVASPFFNYKWQRDSDVLRIGARFRF